MRTPPKTLHFCSYAQETLRLLLSACLLSLYFLQPADANNRMTNVKQVLDELMAIKQLPLLQQAAFSEQSKDLAQLYRMNANRLLWLGEGRSEKNLNDALDVLSNAEADGLNPIDYDAAQLRHYFQQAVSLPQTDVQVLASYDLALSISLLRYIHDLYSGRVDPHNFNYPQQFGTKPPINAVVLLKRSLDQETVYELPQEATPKIKQYSLLKQALADIRQQAANTEPLPKLSFAKPIHPGEYDMQLPLLRQYLQKEGELTQPEIDKANEVELLYDDATKEAVIRLQKQQNIVADGVIGRRTLTMLNQTLKEKITLIELAMERLRWLPAQPSGPQIIVNIPAFQLWALNSPDDDNALNMKVVVGKAEENQTPVLWQEMQYLEFMPYWNIPRSIMDKEILPKMQTARGYLAKQDIELVERNDDHSSEDPQDIIGNIKHGHLRARQLPGKKNPLGKVKFIFPNKDDVYLHDTPFRWAFNQDRRDFSHGCVRVAEAQKLAQFVLSSQQGWDKTAIEQAMSNDKTQRVSLKKSIPVLFFYSTAYAGQDNKLRFYPDIYGLDAQLQDALHKTDKKLVIGKNSIIHG